MLCIGLRFDLGLLELYFIFIVYKKKAPWIESLFMQWANERIWTADLFLTKETLYPWATSANGVKSTSYFRNQTILKFKKKKKIKRAGDRVRTGDIQLGRLTLYQLSYSRFCTVLVLWLVMCGESRIRTCEGKNQQIYSLSSLAAWVSPRNKRADGGTRTHDLLITNQLL